MAKVAITSSDNISEDQLIGYFRPGFYPIKTRTVVPAMVWLSDKPYSSEPDVHYIFVKLSCYLHEWQDALFISEQDFDAAMADCQTLDTQSQKIDYLIHQLTAKGYLPLQKVQKKIKMREVH